MWTRTYTKTFQNISREDVWRIWTDVNHWPQWHADLDYCKMESSFDVGNFFVLKPKGMGAAKIQITEVDEGYSFTDCTSFWGAKMYNTHLMKETKEGLMLTNTLSVIGPLKWLWIKLVARNVAEGLPEETEGLVQLAQKTE